MGRGVDHMSEFARFRPCRSLMAALLASALLVTVACGSAPSAVSTKTPNASRATATPSVAAMAQLAADWRAGKITVDPTSAMFTEDPVTGKKYTGIFLGPTIPKSQIGTIKGSA